MTRQRGPLLLVALALAALSGACAGGGRGDISDAQAREITTEALEASGLSEVVVDADVEKATCESKPPRPGLITTSEVTGGTVRLCLERETGVPIHVYDAGPLGVGKLMTDEQVEQLDAFDPGIDRGVAPAGVAIAGILLAGLVAALVFLVSKGDLQLPWRTGATSERAAAVSA